MEASSSRGVALGDGAGQMDKAHDTPGWCSYSPRITLMHDGGQMGATCMRARWMGQLMTPQVVLLLEVCRQRMFELDRWCSAVHF